MVRLEWDIFAGFVYFLLSLQILLEKYWMDRNYKWWGIIIRDLFLDFASNELFKFGNNGWIWV